MANMQESYFPGSTVSHGPARQRAVLTRVERLEYRPVGHAMESAPHTEQGNKMQTVTEQLLWPSGGRDNVAANNGAPAEARAEEQWRLERAAWEARLAEQEAAGLRAIAAAKEEGRREGRQAAEAVLLEERVRAQQQIMAALEGFQQQRERYFHDVEREVVRLALAIAARVLHRQAQMDPLFLSGAVRVALDKLADSSGVVLRVSPSQASAWQEYFRLHASARQQPEILGDLSLKDGECVLETGLGTIDLGVGAQLEEIEKGFFDLLHHHPTVENAPGKTGMPPSQ